MSTAPSAGRGARSGAGSSEGVGAAAFASRARHKERKGRSRFGVRGRLFATTLALIIITELVSGIIFQRHLTGWLEREEVKRSARAAEAISRNLGPIRGDGLSSEQLRWLERSAALFEAQLSIFSVHGVALYHSGWGDGAAAPASSTPALPAPPLSAFRLSSGHTRSGARIHSLIEGRALAVTLLVEPLERAGHPALIRVMTPVTRLATQRDHLTRVLWSIFAVSLALALLISGLAAQLLSQTLRRLVLLARALATGEQGREINFEGRDEYSRLARSLTMLATQIEEQVSHLAESRDRFGAVLDAMREGVIALDRERRVSIANQSACQLLGWGAPPLGEQLEDRLEEESLIQFLREQAAADAPWVELEFKGRRTLLARLTAQSLTEGEVLVLHDITALRRLEAVRRDFVANVSHELRTPTTVIQANAETLLDGALDEPEIAVTFLEGIHRNAQRLAHLVSDLLDLSRIESGTYRFQGERLNPREIVNRVVDTLADQLVAKKLEVEIELGDVCELYTDAGALEQVFTNLVENAVSYSEERGKVEIYAERRARPLGAEAQGPRGFISFSVIDNGPGISRDHQRRIFERFYRVDKGRSRQLGGTGLGLAIVKHLCQVMGGEVGLESEVGQGCRFWFTIPEELPPSVGEEHAR